MSKIPLLFGKCSCVALLLANSQLLAVFPRQLLLRCSTFDHPWSRASISKILAFSPFAPVLRKGLIK